MTSTSLCQCVITQGINTGQVCERPIALGSRTCQYCTEQFFPKMEYKARCIYVFGRGSRKGDQCENTTISGVHFCGTCVSKTMVQNKPLHKCGNIFMSQSHKIECDNDAVYGSPYCFSCLNDDMMQLSCFRDLCRNRKMVGYLLCEDCYVAWKIGM